MLSPYVTASRLWTWRRRTGCLGCTNSGSLSRQAGSWRMAHACRRCSSKWLTTWTRSSKARSRPICRWSSPRSSRWSSTSRPPRPWAPRFLRPSSLGRTRSSDEDDGPPRRPGPGSPDGAPAGRGTAAAVPTISRIAVLVNPASPPQYDVPMAYEAEAQALRVSLQRVEAHELGVFDAILATLGQSGAEALMSWDDAMSNGHRHRLLELALM